MPRPQGLCGSRDRLGSEQRFGRRRRLGWRPVSRGGECAVGGTSPRRPGSRRACLFVPWTSPLWKVWRFGWARLPSILCSTGSRPRRIGDPRAKLLKLLGQFGHRLPRRPSCACLARRGTCSGTSWFCCEPFVPRSKDFPPELRQACRPPCTTRGLQAPAGSSPTPHLDAEPRPGRHGCRCRADRPPRRARILSTGVRVKALERFPVTHRHTPSSVRWPSGSSRPGDRRRQVHPRIVQLAGERRFLGLAPGAQVPRGARGAQRARQTLERASGSGGSARLGARSPRSRLPIGGGGAVRMSNPVRFLRSFSQALSTLGLYGPSHPVTARGMESAYAI